MAQETFYSYSKYRYLVLNLVVIFFFTLLYMFDNPIGGRSGGTFLGYALGTFAAAGILYLMWYGMRKRSYHAKYTTLKGCLSAHVWLGVSLSVIVPLHCAFSFDYNVHTLAYVLMMIVIISGIWGAIRYVDLAPEIGSHRGAGTVKKHLEQIRIMDADIDSLLKDKSDSLLDFRKKLDHDYKPSVMDSLFGKRASDVDKTKASKLLQNIAEDEQKEALKLISLIDKKRELIAEVQVEISIMTRLKIWLYFHLPVSFALVAAVAIHIITVFYYW